MTFQLPPRAGPGLRPQVRGAGKNGVIGTASTARASAFLNCPGVRCGTGWSSAWPERVAGAAGPLADLAALVSPGLPGVPGPLQLRGRGSAQAPGAPSTAVRKTGSIG